MKLKPIITSLLETDAYKFNMGNIIFKRFNNYITTWSFKCRNANVKFTAEMVQEIREQIDYFCSRRFTNKELIWLKNNLPWLSEGYINFLKYWQPERNEIIIQHPGEEFREKIVYKPYNDCGLAIEARGPWFSTSMYEIPILAIVNEVYFAFKYGENAKDKIFKEKTIEKINRIKTDLVIGPFSEFGMRRRLSSDTQDWLVKYLKNNAPNFVGTSNVYLAKKHNVKAIGTMAHEFIQCIGQGDQMYNPAYSNKLVMKVWTDEYQTRNGIYLTDCIKTDTFLKDFNLTYATLFSGVRHDSGNPYTWADKILKHYESLGIDSKTKTLLFSDSLNFEKAADLYKEYEGKCHVAFGIGTYLSNDINEEPLNIVMKVTECNNYPVAKISDVDGKCMCRDSQYLDYLNRCINWRMNHK